MPWTDQGANRRRTIGNQQPILPAFTKSDPPAIRASALGRPKNDRKTRPPRSLKRLRKAFFILFLSALTQTASLPQVEVALFDLSQFGVGIA